MSFVDMIAIFSFLTGIAAFICAMVQIKKVRRIKDMERDKCKERCDHIVGIVSALSQETNIACRMIEAKMMNSSGEKQNKIIGITIAELASKINGITVATDTLINYCKKINAEYKNDWGEYVVSNIDEKFRPVRVAISCQSSSLQNLL